MTVSEPFTHWLKHRRKALDLTQEELARQVGCAMETIRKFEAGQRRPSKDIAHRLVVALELAGDERTQFLAAARGLQRPVEAPPGPASELTRPSTIHPDRPRGGAESPRASRAGTHDRDDRDESARGRLPMVAGDGAIEHLPVQTRATCPHNLPVQRDVLIGRERERAAIGQLIQRDHVGLVTLTGTGGVGKTRLALQVAADLLDGFTDGVWFVDLAPIRDLASVIATVARTLGVKNVGGEPLLETLTAFLREKQVLLILDNFEQVLPAAPVLHTLLSAAADLKLLVTSRAVLHLSDEHEYPVPPLDVPTLAVADQALPSLEQLLRYDAVELFTQRARRVKPDFTVTRQNARAVVAVCARLDGLPLAIELAGARSKILAPQALLQRLRHPLAVLTGGACDRHERQQTLRRTIDWSYQLLEAAEQCLFTRLAVFVGGCSIEAAQAVCDPDGDLGVDVLDGLTSLVDKGLLRSADVPDGELRFDMLATIHAYAWEQLTASNDAARLRRAHATFFLQLAETAAALQSVDQAAWLDRLAAEQDNVRAVFTWTVEQHERELTLRLGVALQDFYRVQGDNGEIRLLLDRALHQPHHVAPTLQLQALTVAATLAIMAGDYAHTDALLDEALALARELHEPRHLVMVLRDLGIAARLNGEYERARALLEECIALAQKLDDIPSLAWAQGNLASVLRAEGDLAGAVALMRTSHHYDLQVGDKTGAGWATSFLGRMMLEQGDDIQAGCYLAESLHLFHDLHYRDAIAFALDGFAGLAAYRLRPRRAARLLGAATALRDAMHVPLVHRDDMRDYAGYVNATRAQLDENAFTAAWTEGQAMTLEQAVAYALDEPA